MWSHCSSVCVYIVEKLTPDGERQSKTATVDDVTQPHRERTVYGGGLHKLLPQPLLVVAGTEASARHLCPLLTHPISCPTFSQSGQCSFLSFVPLDVRWLVFIGGHLVEKVAKHTYTHQTKQSSHAPLSMAVGCDTLQSAWPRHRRPHTLSIDCKVACTFSPPSASSCSSHS